MDKQLDQLETLLRDLTDAHESLLSLLRSERQALRDANHELVATCCDRENELVQKISELEKQRLRLIGELTEMIAPTAATPLRLDALAERLPEPRRGRLLIMRAQLRERMEKAKEETAVLRRATDALTRHMQGLVQTIAGVMTGMYGRQGSATQNGPTVSTFEATA